MLDNSHARMFAHGAMARAQNLRDRLSSMLHLLVVGAFIPMAVFLVTPHKTRSPMTYVVEVISQWATVPTPLGDVATREAQMNPRELIERWNPLIAQAAAKFRVPADWIRAVMRVESGGRTVAGDGKPITSGAGAVGVMQVMPATYREMRSQYGLGADPYNPHDNVYAGTAYLKWLHGRYGFPAMFAAYNGGPGRLEAFLRGEAQLPKESRNYLDSVTRILGTRRHHDDSDTESPVLAAHDSASL